MVRFFQERFFDVRRHRRPAAPRGGDRRRERARQDMHVHSTFSDGRDRDRGQHRRAPRRSGLTALGCVDHVRVDTDWVPEYVAAVRAAARRRPSVQLRCGIEAKLLDTDRRARPARTAIDGVDAIYAADHQVPLADGPDAPARGRASGSRPATSSAADVIDAILTSTARALDRPQRVVIAHFFSILPKIGLSEADVPAERARAARRRDRADRPGRSRSPSAGAARRPRTLRPFLRRGVTIVLSHRQPQARDDRPLRALPRGAARARERAEPVGVLEWHPRRSFVLAGRAAAGRRLLPVRARGPAPLPATAQRRAARARAERRGGRPGVERGGGDRPHDRHAARARLPAPTGCASTSSTTPAPTRRPTSCAAKAAEYPGPRRSTCAASKGGEGKAHTLNHGLRDDPRRGLVRGGADHRRRRDLHPPTRCGGWRATSPTRRSARSPAYIKEGSRPANYMNRFIAFEYITRAGRRPARAERARRAGLPRRRRAAARGARASRRSAARSTPRRSPRTRSRRSTRSSPGRRVVFEPHAIVWAEEPRDDRRRCGSSGCAGPAATCRSRCATADIWFRRWRAGRLGGVELRADLVLGLPDAGR